MISHGMEYELYVDKVTEDDFSFNEDSGLYYLMVEEHNIPAFNGYVIYFTEECYQRFINTLRKYKVKYLNCKFLDLQFTEFLNGMWMVFITDSFGL